MKSIITYTFLIILLSGCLTSTATNSEPSKDLNPKITNQLIEATISKNTVITLGPLIGNGNEAISYTISASDHYTTGPNKNQITYRNDTLGTEVLDIQGNYGTNTSISAKITINITIESPSNYITNRDIILPSFGSSAPRKNEIRVDPSTGAKITRLTDANELEGSNDALIVYSRYSPENSSGEYFLAFGANSSTSWVIKRGSGDIINKLYSNDASTIGEYHEVRWDLSGNHPNRIYFRDGMGLYKIDNITIPNPTATLIKDFSSTIPNATIIYNDVEGDSSNDSDHWAFMAAHYNGVTYVVDAFVHYQISTDTTHTFTPNDLAGTALDHYSEEDAFPRPNMVEVSPLGTGIVLHYGRAWGDAGYGSRPDDIGTWFDGAHIWPLDFTHESQTPSKISIGETHSGWAYDDDGMELFISQNNRTDQLDAIHVTGDDAGYDNRIEIAEHSDFGWSNGFHYGKMPVTKPGWVFINTYSNISSQYHLSDWAADQIIMMELKSKNENPIIWRILPNYNRYDGNYRDEAPAAINYLGNRIYLSTNWGGELDHREVFLIDLPNDWDTSL